MEKKKICEFSQVYLVNGEPQWVQQGWEWESWDPTSMVSHYTLPD